MTICGGANVPGDAGGDLGQVVAAHRVDLEARALQLGVPRRDLANRLALAQSDVPLPQGALVPSPSAQELWFHVERSPVEEPAPFFGPALQEGVGTCIKHPDRQGLRDLGHARVLGVEPQLGAIAGADCQTVPQEVAVVPDALPLHCPLYPIPYPLYPS